MQRFHILLLLLFACFATAIQAQTPATAPKPNPELKKLAVLVGHWTQTPLQFLQHWKRSSGI
jgi:hypothetical protein